MRILGIHDGHVASASLLKKNGKNYEIAWALHEDRFNRIKEWQGLPVQSIDYILQREKNIDEVVFSYRTQPLHVQQFMGNKFSFNKFAFNMFKTFMPKSLLKRNFWVGPLINIAARLRKKENIYKFFSQYGIDKRQISFADHHLCHAYTLFYNWWRQEDGLFLSLDGSGDGFCASVNIAHDGKIKNISKTNIFSSLGWIYAWTTKYLGMKPASEEWKVMGLAAYGKEKYYKDVAEIYKKKFMRVNGLQFENLSGCWNEDYLEKMHREFKNVRFDNLAAGLQQATEELVLEWISNAMKKTGIKDIFCSGGVFMNVKVNQKIKDVLKPDKLMVFPSCSDESSAIGANIFRARQLDLDMKMKELGPIYWGPEYSEKEIVEALDDSPFSFEKVNNIERFTTERLAEGKIIARFNGRLEFGARALGNRSILMDPRNLKNLRTLNLCVKNRDFWMPFSLSLINSDRYLINPMKSPYMMMGFDTKPEAQEVIAGLHQSDLSCRPQILEKEFNPSYYKVIDEFERLTGVPVILNTSFNIHTHPIVCSPQDAIFTMQNSGLEIMTLGDYVVTKPKNRNI